MLMVPFTPELARSPARARVLTVLVLGDFHGGVGNTLRSGEVARPTSSAVFASILKGSTK